MAKFEKGNNLGRQFSKEYQPESNGRRPNVYTILKDKGYSSDDITAGAHEMAFYTESELQEAANDPASPVIYRIMAGNYLNALQTGCIKDIEHALILASKSDTSEPQQRNTMPTQIIYSVLEPQSNDEN